MLQDLIKIVLYLHLGNIRFGWGCIIQLGNSVIRFCPNFGTLTEIIWLFLKVIIGKKVVSIPCTIFDIVLPNIIELEGLL